MKNFDWDAFGREKIAVWCKTEEEAKDFCKQSHEHGYDWCDGRKRNEITYWEDYREETCYITDEFTGREYYEDLGYVILEWSDYMATLKPTFTKSDLKDGDFILRRNGNVEIAIPSAGGFACEKSGFNMMFSTSEDLSCIWGNENIYEWDIIEVRRPKKPIDCRFECFAIDRGEVVYNRERDTEPVVDMTFDEICKALGKKIKIVGGE